MAGAEARSSPNPRSDWRLNVDDSPKKTIGFNKKLPRGQGSLTL
jgi:hypothetical protein